MKKFNKLILFFLIFVSLNSFAQNFVCSSDGYQNIVRNGNNSTNTKNILILNIFETNINAEMNNEFDHNKMKKVTFKIVSRNNESISGYEVSPYDLGFSISSLSIHTQERIATRVVVNPYGASVILYKCFAK